MKIHVLSGLLLATGVMAMCGTVGLTGTTNTISFNPDFIPPTITFGSNNCVDSVCSLGGSQSMGATTINWSFTQPDSGTGNPSVFTFSYSAGSGVISTTGSPTLGFSISDGLGDSASGTYALDTLSSGDGGNTIDIAGIVTLSSLNDNGDLADFQNLLGIPAIPPDATVPFDLVVGDCTRGGKSTTCISDTDPTATVLSLTLDTPVGAPEPGTFVLLGLGLVGVWFFRRLSQPGR